MISCSELQTAYNDFYACMREYVWDMDVVEILAELEVECYDAFPDREKLLQTAEKLERELFRDFKEDEELKTSFDALKKIIEDDASIYVPLFKVNEVLVKED